MTSVAEPITTIPEVERGAAWLDENVPGWWDEIHLGVLDLSHCEFCISGQLGLGQIFVEQGVTEPLTGHLTRYPSQLGMDAGPGQNFLELQHAWEDEILRRRDHHG